MLGRIPFPKSNRGQFLLSIPFVVILSWIGTTSGGDLAVWVSSVFTPAFALATAALIAVLYRLNRRTPFKEIGLGLLILGAIMAFSWVAWGFYIEVLGELPEFSVADIGWLSGSFALIALLAKVILDAHIRISSNLVLVQIGFWVLMVFFLYSSAYPAFVSPDLDLFEKLIIGMYPIQSAIILSLLIVLFWLHRKGQLEDVWYFLSISWVVLLAGDMIFAAEKSIGEYVAGSLSDSLYLSGTALMAIGFGILVRRRVQFTSIAPVREVDTPKGDRPVLEARRTYIVTGEDTANAYNLMRQNLDQGLEGLIISRKRPEIVKTTYGLKKTPVLWIGTTPGEGNIYPTSLGILSDTIVTFFERGSNTIVLFDGFESLMVHNDFRKALLLIDHLKCMAAHHQSRLMVVLDSRALSVKELSLVTKGAEVIAG